MRVALISEEMKFCWEFDDHFNEEMSSCFSGMRMLNDHESESRFEFIETSIIQPLYVK